MSLLLETIAANVDEALRLLQDKAVRKSASENDNEALLFAAERGHTAVVIELLKIKTVRDNAAAKNNDALHSVAMNGNTAVVIELLKIKTVRDNAATGNNQALSAAAQDGHIAIVIELLKIKTVRDNAAGAWVNPNRWEGSSALYLAAQNGHTAVVIKLLTIQAVQDNAAAEDNKALRSATQDGHIAIAFELLKIKTVRDNAAANNNDVLLCAAMFKRWSIFLELLKIEAVRDILASCNHEALRKALAVDELGIVSLLIDIYKEKDIPIPDDIASEFEKRSKSLLAKNTDVESMALLVTDIFKNNGNTLLDLLKDEKVKNIAAFGNNLALIFTARNGQIRAVLKLIKITEVRANAAARDNEVLLLAACNGHLEVVSALLTLEPVHANLNARHHEVLRAAITADKLKVVLLLMRVYREKNILLPPDFAFSFFGEQGESIQSLSTLEENLQKTYHGASIALSSWPQAVIELLFEYADLPTHFDKASASTAAPTSPSLLLSGGPSENNNGVKELMDNLQALKSIMKGNQNETKEALEACLRKIAQTVTAHPKISPDMLVMDGKKLTSVIQEWFSDYEALYNRLQGIFSGGTRATLSASSSGKVGSF